MGQQTGRKTFKYQLQPTPQQAETQEETLAVVVRRCRALYNAGLQERRDAWQKCGVSLPAASQSAPVPELKDVRPEYREVHSQVLQAVLTRLDSAFRDSAFRDSAFRDSALQACFRRVRAGETPGYPRCHGATRYSSFTYTQFGHGAPLAKGVLVLSQIGRRASRWSRPLESPAGVARWSRPLEGTPKTVTLSREAAGWYTCFSCEEVPIQPLPPPGQETGSDLGLESFATLAAGSQIANPRMLRVAERRLKRAQRRVARRPQGSHRRRKAVRLLRRAHQQVRRARHDFQHKTALALVRQYATLYFASMPPSILKRCRRPTWSRTSPLQSLFPCKVYGRRGVEWFLEHPLRQGSVCRSERRSCAACLDRASL